MRCKTWEHLGSSCQCLFRSYDYRKSTIKTWNWCFALQSFRFQTLWLHYWGYMQIFRKSKNLSQKYGKLVFTCWGPVQWKIIIIFWKSLGLMLWAFQVLGSCYKIIWLFRLHSEIKFVTPITTLSDLIIFYYSISINLDGVAEMAFKSHSVFVHMLHPDIHSWYFQWAIGLWGKFWFFTLKPIRTDSP
jgi:hypothetical protein